MRSSYSARLFVIERKRILPASQANTMKAVLPSSGHDSENIPALFTNALSLSGRGGQADSSVHENCFVGLPVPDVYAYRIRLTCGGISSLTLAGPEQSSLLRL